MATGRKRYVSKDISVDAAIARLGNEYGDFAALLYTWMIPHAEDDCSVESDHDQIMLRIIPGLRKKKRADVDKAIEGMIELGLLKVTEKGGYYFPPESFYKYQSYVKVINRRSGYTSQESAENAGNPSAATETPENSVPVPVPVPDPFPVPIPVPISSDPPPPTDDARLDAIAVTFGTFGEVRPSTADDIAWSYKQLGIDLLEQAVHKASASGYEGRPPWSYVESIAERIKQEGPDDQRTRTPPPRAYGSPRGAPPLSVSERAKQRGIPVG